MNKSTQSQCPSPKFCISIAAQNTREAVQKIRSLGQSADIFEIRLDFMEEWNLKEILASSPVPMLVTYRSAEQGGKGHDETRKIEEYLLEAVELGADYVDLELTLPVNIRQRIMEARGRTKAIVSVHILNYTPGHKELYSLFERAHSCGADIVKIVPYARTWEDNLLVVSLIPEVQRRGAQIVAFCMGAKGRISRILSHLLGSHMSFVSHGEGGETAPGQISLREMKAILSFLGYED